MLEKEISKKFEKRLDKKKFHFQSEVRLIPAEIDLILLDKQTHELISYEFKRGNWKKTFLQALRNKLYCHYSYAVLPVSELCKIEKNEFIKEGIGLILFTTDARGISFKELLKPEQSMRVNRQFKKQIYKKFEYFFVGA